MECTKEERINAKCKMFKAAIAGISEQRKKIAYEHCQRAAFMLVSLEDMETQMNEDGMCVEMSQGAYSITRAHPLIAQYNATIKSYNSTIEKLLAMLPEGAAKEKAGNSLMAFAMSAKK